MCTYWKRRLKNKAFLLSFATVIIAAIYQLCGICGFVPPISEAESKQFLGVLVNVLVGIGVIIDPTTPGISDKGAD